MAWQAKSLAESQNKAASLTSKAGILSVYFVFLNLFPFIS